MKRILGSLVASCLLLTGCGKLRSPDFVPVLAGIQISPESAEITQASQTVTFTVVGLFTTPPGTTSDSTTVPCTGSNSPSGLCTLGTLSSGASYTSSNPAIASIRADGVASALRNGTVNIVASAENFQSAPAVLTVRVPVLQTLRISPLDPTVAQGLTQLFSVQGTYSDSPGTLRPVADTVNWSSVNTSIATVSPAQGTSTTARTLARGGTTITASAVNFDGNTVSASTSLTVGAPDLTSIVLTPSSLSIPAGAAQVIMARGIYTNSPDPQVINGVVSWSSSLPTAATVSPPTGSQTTVTAGNAAGQQAFITASSPNNAGTAVTAQATVNITAAVLTGVARVTPANPVVAPTFTVAFQLIGTFSNGTEAQIAPGNVNWTSASVDKARIDANGVATGVAQGSSIITGALKDGVNPEITTSRSAFTVLTVTDAVCTSPFLGVAVGGTATTTTTIGGPGCVNCTVTNANNAIDNNNATFATLSIPLALGTESVSLTAKANPAVPEAFTPPVTGQRAGFVISRNDTLTAAILTQINLRTLNAAGVVVESSTAVSESLRLVLVGTSAAGDRSGLVSINATKPFSSLQIELRSGGVGGVLALQVNSACSVVSLPATP